MYAIYDLEFNYVFELFDEEMSNQISGYDVVDVEDLQQSSM